MIYQINLYECDECRATTTEVMDVGLFEGPVVGYPVQWGKALLEAGIVDLSSIYRLFCPACTAMGKVPRYLEHREKGK